MYNLLLEAGGAAAEGGAMSSILSFAPLIIIVVVMYFLMIRPQRKREKETQAMRSKIDVGDEITTVGGIIGIVVSLREDSVVIETGSDRSKLRITRWAIQSNNTVHDTPAETK